MVLYVARHGETDYNAQGRYAGSTDVPINQKGVCQAQELAERLTGMTFDAVISSPMLRARQTADIVCSVLDMQYTVYEEFAERDMGIYEGMIREEANKRHHNLHFSRLHAINPDEAPEGGESLRQVCDRINHGMRRLYRDYGGQNILLICHGFSARAVHRYCHDLSFDEMPGEVLKNCEYVSYNWNEGTDLVFRTGAYSKAYT